MLPSVIEELAEKLRVFPGIGKKSSQKLSIDVLQLTQNQFDELINSLMNARQKVRFCSNCGFFAQDELCEICKNKSRDQRQICLVEKPTDVLIIEKSHNYFGTYHVLKKLISPLDNIFPPDTTIDDLFHRRIKNLLDQSNDNVELILFFRNGFAAEATTAYINQKIKELNLQDKIYLTRLAQGLPLYYNLDSLDQATIAKAIEDRRKVFI